MVAFPWRVRALKAQRAGAGAARSARGAPPTTRDDAGWAGKREAP